VLQLSEVTEWVLIKEGQNLPACGPKQEQRKESIPTRSYTAYAIQKLRTPFHTYLRKHESPSNSSINSCNSAARSRPVQPACLARSALSDSVPHATEQPPPRGCSPGLGWFGVSFVWAWEGVVSLFASEKGGKRKCNRPRGIKIIHSFTLK